MTLPAWFFLAIVVAGLFAFTRFIALPAYRAWKNR